MIISLIINSTDVNVNNSCTLETILTKEHLRNEERSKEDIDKVNRLQSSPETNHMAFTVLDLGTYFHAFKNMTHDSYQKSLSYL